MKNKQFCTRLAALLLAGTIGATGAPYLIYAQPLQAVEEQTTDQQMGTEAVQYVLMNVPYADFYQAELTGNEKSVDSVSSATLNKTRNNGLVAGSYHVNPNGSDISGVTIPVKLGEGVTLADFSGYTEITDTSSVSITMTSRTGETTTEYKGKDALFEAPNYAYYPLTQAPTYYKEVTIQDGKLQFGPMQGETAQVIQNATAELQDTSKYGDYQLNVSGVEISDSIYGVIISTKEGTSYGMRHLENIWKSGTQLAWSTGFTTTVHNCPLQSAHYESMMGKTIQKLTYYTSGGIYEVPTGDLYVPVKSNESEMEKEDPTIENPEEIIEDEKKTTISLKKTSATIYVKGTAQIQATVKNGTGTTKYKSNKTSVATVNSKGKVTAKKAGTAKISVTNNGVTKSFTVKVKNPTLNKTKVTLKVGKSAILKVKGKIGTPNFTSTNTKVVKVKKNGTILAVKKGSAIIKVKTNGMTLKCKVTVK